MTRRTIGLIDYGAGNLSSVQRALRSLGYRCWISCDREVLDKTDLLILPGVGAYPSAVAGLTQAGLDEYVVTEAHKGRPLIGICLGMQLLVDVSTEYRVTSGLGLIPGRVTALADGGRHIGWNNIEIIARDPLLQPSDGQSFYFNHGYVVEVPPEYQVGIARIDAPLVAAIRRGSIIGLQFHPEKSQAVGRQLLRNVIEGLCQ